MRAAESMAVKLRDEYRKLEEVSAMRSRNSAERAEKAAEEAKSKLQELINLQVTQDQSREERRRFYVRYVLTPIVTVVLGGGGFGIYGATTGPEPHEIQQSFNTRVDKVEKRQLTHNKRIERLGDLHYEQIKLILESNDAVMTKLDQLLERLRVKQALPVEGAIDNTILEDARAGVKAYEDRKRERHEEDLLRDGDPFAGIPDADVTD